MPHSQPVQTDLCNIESEIFSLRAKYFSVRAEKPALRRSRKLWRLIHGILAVPQSEGPPQLCQLVQAKFCSLGGSARQPHHPKGVSIDAFYYPPINARTMRLLWRAQRRLGLRFRETSHQYRPSTDSRWTQSFLPATRTRSAGRHRATGRAGSIPGEIVLPYRTAT
jgi:hypothetical protein